MAEIFAAPESIETPDLTGDIASYLSACVDYQDRVKDWCKAQFPEDGLAGSLVSWPVADGQARYVVMTTRPLRLIHLADGDGYRLQGFAERGLRVRDVREALRRRETLNQLFEAQGEEA